jgi:transposase-like protein
MTTLKSLVFTLVKLFHSVKDEDLQWKKTNQDQQVKLKHARVLAAKTLEAELKKKSIRLAHEITLLKTKNETELSMFKTKCKQDIKDYKQYLASLDQLKRSIQSSYTHLPEAVAFTIHHHAKYLLNQMWEAEDLEQKMHYEMQLINFMTTVHEDARLHLENATAEKLPEKTLKLIKQRY